MENISQKLTIVSDAGEPQSNSSQEDYGGDSYATASTMHRNVDNLSSDSGLVFEANQQSPRRWAAGAYYGGYDTHVVVRSGGDARCGAA